jgi:hypothetical protein
VTEWLDNAECIVLDLLEASPLSMPEMGWPETPSRQRVAETSGRV